MKLVKSHFLLFQKAGVLLVFFFFCLFSPNVSSKYAPKSLRPSDSGTPGSLLWSEFPRYTIICLCMFLVCCLDQRQQHGLLAQKCMDAALPPGFEFLSVGGLKKWAKVLLFPQQGHWSVALSCCFGYDLCVVGTLIITHLYPSDEFVLNLKNGFSSNQQRRVEQGELAI